MFAKLKKNLDKSLVTVSVKSSTYLESEKLKAKIENLQADSAMQLQIMGNQIYDNWKGTKQIDDNYIHEVCKKVLDNETEITLYESKIQELLTEQEKILNTTAMIGTEGELEKEEGIRCSCGYMNDENAKFCKVCGNKLEKPAIVTKKVCPYCNTVIESEAKFCVECGKPVE